MEKPLVSIIILCYNQKNFVEEAINSAINQSYEHIEIIVIDDASNDGSQEIITRLGLKHGFKTILNKVNIGNCKSFNNGIAISSGDYIIDLAADDILLPDRAELGVKNFQKLEPEYGVNYTDAIYIDQFGNRTSAHYKRNGQGELLEYPPEGFIFKELLQRYIICTPTMMMKRQVIEYIGGYNETLTYEDFDFWIRTSQKFKYSFTNEVLVKKRVVPGSLSSRQRKFANIHLKSTYITCQQAARLCRHREDFAALRKRINYESKWALRTGNILLAAKFSGIYFKTIFR